MAICGGLLQGCGSAGGRPVAQSKLMKRSAARIPELGLEHDVRTQTRLRFKESRIRVVDDDGSDIGLVEHVLDAQELAGLLAGTLLLEAGPQTLGPVAAGIASVAIIGIDA